MAAKMPGKGLSGTQVSKPSGVHCQTTGGPHGGADRGERRDPPKGPAQIPGRSLSKTQTRNSNPIDA